MANRNGSQRSQGGVKTVLRFLCFALWTFGGEDGQSQATVQPPSEPAGRRRLPNPPARFHAGSARLVRLDAAAGGHAVVAGLSLQGLGVGEVVVANVALALRLPVKVESAPRRECVFGRHGDVKDPVGLDGHKRLGGGAPCHETQGRDVVALENQHEGTASAGQDSPVAVGGRGPAVPHRRRQTSNALRRLQRRAKVAAGDFAMFALDRRRVREVVVGGPRALGPTQRCGTEAATGGNAHPNAIGRAFHGKKRKPPLPRNQGRQPGDVVANEQVEIHRAAAAGFVPVDAESRRAGGRCRPLVPQRSHRPAVCGPRPRLPGFESGLPQIEFGAAALAQ